MPTQPTVFSRFAIDTFELGTGIIRSYGREECNISGMMEDHHLHNMAGSDMIGQRLFTGERT